jgi:ABC-2 type transport system permease protein
MQAELAVASSLRLRSGPRSVVAGLTARKALRSGALWGYIFGAAIASSAISYTKIYKTFAQREALATAYGSNQATSALFGPAPRLETVAGFTAFKISMTLIILGAVWGLLTSTRLLRGEEEDGRWELLLSGQTTRRSAAAQALGGLGVGLLALWAVTALITAVIGLDSSVNFEVGPSLYFALAMVMGATMFLAVGALTSQLAATRRQAASYAAMFLGVAYAIRLLADAGVGLHPLIWASPIGWIEELRPFTSPRPQALVPIFAFTAAVAVAAVRLAGDRDVGASIIADQPNAPAHLGLLFGSTGLAIRMLRASVIGWWVAIGIAGLLFGVIAKSAGGTISGSSVQQVFSKLGASGTGPSAVLGVCFLLLAVLVAFMAAGQLSAARSEESSGRIDHILVGPISRTKWLGGRLCVATAVVLASGVLAGLAAWLGAASQGAGVSFATLLGAGVNVVPPALALLGVGVFTFGVAPRATSVVVHSILGWSFFIVIVGGIGGISHWVLDTSLFHQMSSAPAVSPHWVANGAMVGIGLAGALVGGLAFRRRDVQGQ